MNKTRKNYLANKPKLLFYGAGAFLLLAIVLLGVTIGIQKNNAALLHVQPSSAFGIHQKIHSGDVIMSVENVKFQKGQAPFSAPSGKHYAIIDFWIKNISDAPIQVLPSSDTYMKNVAGDVSYLSPYALKQPFRAGEIAPGEAIHGDLSYLIDATGTVKLFVDAKWSGIAVPLLVQSEED